MIIHELTAAECEEFLNRATVGRLGCSHKGQPYIVPVSLYFGREEKCLYGFSTVGRKIEWMRENPSVCVEIDAISDPYQWTTVLVMGRYEELDGSDQQRRARQRALELFQDQSRWWLPRQRQALVGRRTLLTGCLPDSHRVGQRPPGSASSLSVNRSS